MATYTKPTDIPRWADTTSNVVEPSESKKDAGWVFEEIPPSSYENWKAKLNGEWWKWVDERFSDGASADELRSLFPLEIQDEDFKLVLNGNPAVVFDAGDDDFMQYDRSTNTYEYRIANAIEYELDASGADWHGNALASVGAFDCASADISSGGITNAGAISGAADIDGTGDLTMGTITMTGFDVDASGNVSAADIDGTGDLTMSTITMTGFSVDALGNVITPRLEIESDFVLTMSGGNAWVFMNNVGGNVTGIYHQRTNDQMGFALNNVTEMNLEATGLTINKGLVVGDGALTPADNEIRCTGDITSNSRVFRFGIGSNDYIRYNDTLKRYDIIIDNGIEYSFSSTLFDAKSNDITTSADLTAGTITMTGFSVDADGDAVVKSLDASSGGITNAGAISGATSIDGTGDLTMGSITMTGNIRTTGQIGFDASDYMDFSNNTYMRWWINSVNEMHLHAGQGLSVDKGLSVGYLGAGACEDGKFYMNGDIDSTGWIESGDDYYVNGGTYYFVRQVDATGDPSRLEYTGTQIRTYLGSTMIMQVISSGIEMQNKDISGINALAAWGADEITFKDDIAFDEIDPKITFDTGDYIWYDESENIFGFVEASYTWNRWEARLPNDSNTTYFQASTTVAYADATVTVRQEDLSNQGWFPPDHDTSSGAAWATQVSANYAPSFPTMRLIGAANQSSSGNDVVSLEFWDSPRSAASDQGITGAIWGFGGDFDIGTLGRNGQMSVYGHQGLYLHTGLGGPSGTFGIYLERDDSVMCQFTSSGTSTNIGMSLGYSFTDLVTLNINGDDGRLNVGDGFGSIVVGGSSTTEDRAYIKLAAGLTTDILYSTNYPAIYGKDNGAGSKDIWVTDSANNHTQISPHVDGDRWVFRSKNPVTGRNIEVDMDKLVALVEKLSGETLVKHFNN